MFAPVQLVFVSQCVHRKDQNTLDVFELKNRMCLTSVNNVLGRTLSPLSNGSTRFSCLSLVVTSRPVALLMNTCGFHGAELNFPTEQVTIMTLPPNFTALHQPIDMETIST